MPKSGIAEREEGGVMATDENLANTTEIPWEVALEERAGDRLASALGFSFFLVSALGHVGGHCGA